MSRAQGRKGLQPRTLTLNNTEVPGGIGAARDWLPALTCYRAPSQLRSLFEIAITAVPFLLLWILMWASLV